jgi:hypothetical protein
MRSRPGTIRRNVLDRLRIFGLADRLQLHSCICAAAQLQKELKRTQIEAQSESRIVDSRAARHISQE